MMKSFLFLILITALAQAQTITPYYLLPVQSTKNVITSYSFNFYTDTEITSNAWVAVTFPFEFPPNTLNQATRVRYSTNDGQLKKANWNINLYTFKIQIDKISIGNITVVIEGILNPTDYTTSSFFTVQTLFKNVVVTTNQQFGRVPFTSAPVATTGTANMVKNYVNTYIEQGSSWTFNFTLTGSYPANSSIRFIFPENYYSNKIQCNVSGIIDPDMETRVFPAQNVYDCLNLKQPLSGALLVILSGVVNPNFQTTSTGFQVHILQPNNMIVNEVITSSSSVLIQNKPLNLTMTIPNNYRNTSSTYIFQINPDTTLSGGDYMVFAFDGLWTFKTDSVNVISGLVSDSNFTAKWKSVVDTTNSKTTITLSNFSSIPRTTQFTFYLPLKTPLLGSNYAYTVKAFRANGGLAQSYANTTLINSTTGYIREMKLHPMQRAIKLPVGQTGPLEIVLFLQNNLPQTNVLTYGKIVMDIKPNIPAPIVNLNGVPKCYFYQNIPAANCTFDSASDPLKTTVTIFTPVNFNFRESEVPLTITTEGYQQPFNQGITIDTLVKRYFFEIQFYTHLRPPPIPQQVIFDEWIPDSIPITSVSCISATYNQDEYDHIKCQFTTPNQILNSDGHIHFFRVQFYSDYYPWYGWYAADNNIVPNYPCLMYGTNVSADPYVKCDYVTWQTGPYKSSQSSTSYNYINFYGLSTIPGGSLITFEIPKIQRRWNGYYTSFKFSILEDTPGFSSPIVYIYTQNVASGTNYGWVGGYNQQTPSMTLSNNIINKVTSITLNSYNIGTAGATHIIFQVESTAFPNIGRATNIACGSHVCSKFDKPIQYFILYPSSTLSSTASLTFPSIATPAYSDNFVFYLRLYKDQSCIKKVWFNVLINPDTITDRSYKFSPLESITTLYPNSDHFYVISWTTVNPVASVLGASKISITINNIFSFSSTYCNLVTTATAYDGRGIMCELSAGGTVVNLKNLADLPAGATFNLTLQLRSTSSASTVSPTLDIKTFHGNGKIVDQAVSVPFATTPLTNTNLVVFSTFDLPTSYTTTRAITAGYFGNLLVSFQPKLSTTVNDGSKIVLSMPTGFSPSVNSLGLPLSCRLNNIRYTCTYSINPFVITMTSTNNGFTTGSNVINITTLYQASNGIYFPSTSGRYLLTLQIINNTSSVSLQKTQQYIDILPPDISYFNVTWAHRDINQYNIFTVEFKNGPNAIPSYKDATSAGRIYIGFPTVDASSGSVFASDLGFTGIKQGNVLPCYFEAGANFVTPVSNRSLTCKIRMSRLTNKYYTWIQIIDFDIVPAGAVLRVIIGKIRNPSSNQIDINFLLKVNTLAVSTNIETTLYQTSYNMFIDMRTASITNRNEVNSSTLMFQPGSAIGDTNKYMNITPYSASSFSQNDWFIMDLDPQFPLSGNIYNCQSPFYQYCIIYPTINWLAIKIGNGTIISLQPFITKLPISLSRTDTTYQCYTFKSGRWSETITYTIAALVRWLELRGSITNFALSVLGSQNKLNVGQKNVEVMVSFTVSHMVPVGGTIQIQFPSNANTVPAIKPHCRSAVTMGSALKGFNTGKPSTNMQGQIGCLVQIVGAVSPYSSWVITGFDQLPANSQVKIVGQIDFPTIVTNTLGMGYVVTYSTQHSTNVFTYGKTIDYLSTNFPLAVQNLTWNVEPYMSMLQTKALRINYVGQLKFLLNLGTTLSNWAAGGYVRINTWQKSITGVYGGFYDSGQPTPACTIFNPTTKQKYGCEIYIYQTAVGAPDYVGYHITTFEDLPANTNYEFTITTQKGSATEGIFFPTTIGTYKIEIQVEYYTSSPYNKNQAYYIDTYGPDFSTLFFNSTVSIPGENNFIMVIFTPPSTINADQQLVIEIPTVSVDSQQLFSADLGMGYKNYDDLIFDIFESGISSMTCKVYTGQVYSSQPVKIICSNFNSAITSGMTVKIGFWVVNPSTTKGLSIPVQVYILDQPSQTKIIWSMVEAGIRLLPTSVTPTIDDGNFYVSSTARQAFGINLEFTSRNSRALVKDDWYIMKFNFDLRNNANTNSAFSYNTNMAGSGDVIFMRNCKTILLRIGVTPVSIVSPGSTPRNARINSLIYNPSYQLSTLQATIIAYAVYNSADSSERIYYSDLYPTLYPMQPTSPTFLIDSVYGTMQMGQPDDWRFTFKMSSVTGNSSNLVKLISIQFPSATVYDITMQGKQCFQYSSSDIQVNSCVIDIDSRVIWISPFVKSTYTNDKTLIIESAGYAFISPVVSTSINRNKFVIRYYTWPDGQSQPNIVAGSDDWCFMKQDSDNIASSLISFTTLSATYYSPHTFVEIPKEVIVAEWEPADYMIGNASTLLLAKTPFRFKFIAPTTFNALSGGQQHSISLTFSTYYSVPTLNQQIKDLYYYVPSCQLNGFRIHSCSISSGVITMSFQQTLSNGQEVSVKFSVLNPLDQGDEGFTLITTTNSGTITLPVTISQYAGTTYYFQAEPFHPFYRATSAGATYPSMGISNVALNWGTQAHNQFNYLDFVITLTRNDINGLVLEIPVVSEDGTKIYNNPTLMGLQSGSKYPCSMGVYAAVYCFYVQGSSTNYGSPTRIYVSGFTVPGNNSLSFRMLFTNPDIPQVFPKFNFRAFGGSYSAPDLMGSELRGYYELVQPFKVYSSNVNSYNRTGSLTCQPSKALWQTQTIYYCYTTSENLVANSYVILKWPLVDASKGTIGDYDSSSGFHYDHFIVNEGLNSVFVYIVTKYSGGWSTGTGHHDFGYIRMKHHIINNYNLYVLNRDYIKLYTANVDSTWVWNNRANGGAGQFGVDVIDAQFRKCDAWSWHYMSINTASANSYGFNGRQNSQLVVEITFDSAGRTFNALDSGHPICNIDSGVIGFDALNPVTCTVNTGASKIQIRNIYALTSSSLRIHYYGRMACSQTDFDVTVKVFANQDAYSDYNWPLYSSTTNNNWNLNSMYYSSYPAWSYGSTYQRGFYTINPGGEYNASYVKMYDGSTNMDSGYTRVISVSTNSITVRVQLSNNDYDFGDSTYRLGFRFYTERLTYNGPCSISSVSSSRYNSNGWCQQGGCSNTCQVGDRMFWLGFYLYRNSYYQSQWPIWRAGDYYDFTVSFSSVGQDSNNNANEIFVHANVLWQTTRYHSNDIGKCGCRSGTYRCSQYCGQDTCDSNIFSSNYCFCCAQSCCASYGGNWQCYYGNDCRWMYGWDYRALTNGNQDGWSQTPTPISQGYSASLLSPQNDVQTEFSFYLQNLYASLTSTMTSTTGNSAQLVVSFTGVNGISFPYIRSSEDSAYIECLCVVSNSGISINAGTDYNSASPANCTRYTIAGYPPFLTVRINANAGQYLACYFPGFRTPASTGTMYANFYRDTANHFKYNNLPEQFRSNYQSTGIGIGISTSTTYGLSQQTFNNYFWNSTGHQVGDSGTYQYYIRSTGSYNNPFVYISSYSPQFEQNLCNSSSYLTCRAYNSFFSKRYFLVAQINGNTNAVTLSATQKYPESYEADSNKYSTYIGWTYGGYSTYRDVWSSNNLVQSYFAPNSVSKGITTSTYSTFLKSGKPLISLAVQLSGYTLYSNQRTKGPNYGSFIQLVLSGFTSIYGCGASVKNVLSPQWNNNALYCTIYSSTNEIRIYSNADWSFTDYLYVTFYTDNLPASTSYTFKLFDKYYSSSDNGITVQVTGTFGRSPSGSPTIMPPTSVKWRRQTYKQLRNDAGPIRFFFNNNNYQYVSTYDMANNIESTSSDAITFYLPGGGITNDPYYCYAREYQTGKYGIYKQYVVNCQYYSSNQVLVKSIPSHIYNPNYIYEFIIYKNLASSMLISIPSASKYIAQVTTRNSYTGGSIQFLDYIPVLNYLDVKPIALNKIFILTREAAAINSLLVDFTINIAQSGSNIFYIEFEFSNFDLNYFNIQNGGSIPCYLSGFGNYTGKQNGPRCFGYAKGTNGTTPLFIRVLNFAGFSSGVNYKVAFDNFNNPPITTLYLIPINLRLSLVDRTNTRLYTSYFPNIYYSDSINIVIPSNLAGSISMTDARRGVANYHYLNLYWPYSSNNADSSQKFVFKIEGGITSCNAFSTLSISDSQAGGYNVIWSNLATNITVYEIPSKSSGVLTNVTINTPKNPQLVNYQTYLKVYTVTFIMYSSYQTSYITKLGQPAFSSYTVNSDFVISAPSLIQSTANFNFHSYFPMTYQIYWNIGASSYVGRNISYAIIYFTSGVRWIDAAWMRYAVSPSYVNKVGNPKVGYDSSNSQWYVNVTGITDSIVSSSYNWYVRVRLYANGNGNYIYYTTSIYNYNGMLEFTNSNSNRNLVSDNWSSSANYGTPTNWNLQFQRYTKNYFELMRRDIYAATGQTANKLYFKFTAPYSLTEVESISFISSASTPAPANPSWGLYCIIQPKYVTISVFGKGLYAPCSYNSGSKTYSVGVPIGGLTVGEYLLTIIERRQLTTTFNMPTTPQRLQISLIYNSMLNIQYGDVYTLDFPGTMTSYSVSHLGLMTGQFSMIGFTFTPSFTLPAASTSSPITESVISFEFDSTYYESCLSLRTNVYAADSMDFYSGVYFTHWSNPPYTDANTRILCGQSTQAQNWAPIKLTTTDYTALTGGVSYYFRFPLITMPLANNSPLTYKVKLLQYANGYHYPTIISQCRFQNVVQTTNSVTINNIWAYLTASNDYVQKTMTLNFNYHSSYFNIYNTGFQTLVKFQNDNIPALTSITTLAGLTSSNSNYNYQYYPNINLCIFIKNTDNNNYGFTLGTYPTSTDQQSYKVSYVYTYTSNTVINRGWFNAGLVYALNTITVASSWTTSSFTRGGNILTSSTMDLYTVSWSANYLTFPQGSYMILTFSNNFVILDEYCYSYSGFIAGVDSNSNIVCKRYSTTQIMISGYGTLATSSSLSIKLYMQFNNIALTSYSLSVGIIVYSSTDSIIINANTASLGFTISQWGSPSLALSGTMNIPYAAGSAYPLYITFKLTSNTLVNGDYLQIDFGNWVIDPATLGTPVFKYQISGNIYWVPSQASLVSGNIWKVPVYLNYSMVLGNLITLMVDSFCPTTYSGAKDPTIQWNDFKIYAYRSTNVLVEQQIKRIWTQPFNHPSFVSTPALRYASAIGLWQFSVTPNISATAGDSILIEFLTADGIQSTLFSNNLGRTIPAGSSGYFDCAELYNTHVISNDIIKCRIYAGDSTANPPIPTTIVIPITKNIAANTAISFNIMDIQNPSLSGYPISVVFKLANRCNSQDSINLCAYYKSVYYMTFNAYSAPPGVGSTGTLSFNPTRVSATNTLHTVSAGYSLAIGDFVKLIYYSQIPIPAVCTMSSSNGQCYSYPSTNSIIVKITTASSSPYSIVLANMNNPYQNHYGIGTFNVEIWSSGIITNRFYSSYSATTISTDPTTSTPLSITFTPTLTPNYWLKYGFNNIGKVVLSKFFQNGYVKQIRLTAPSEITLDTQYCNATFQSSVSQAKPYPFRFVCQILSSTVVQLNLFSDFPNFAADFTQRTILIYLRYTISNGQTVASNTWSAYAYSDPSSTSNMYQISYGTGNFLIVEYQTPFLYVINFPTRSFDQRTCTIGQQCMIYGFIFPTTLTSDYTINRMSFVLPREFNYSSQQTFDSCFIQSKTTVFEKFSCSLGRNNSKITVAFKPLTYNQQYNLFNIDHSDATLLFQAPNYPGNHYQMLVNLWTTPGNYLIESQLVNLTTVYGYYLSVPLIKFVIPLDASQKGLFDLTFTVGTADILPSYINSADYTITSGIQITFSNSFAADLGTGLAAGSQIACLNITGLTFNIMGKITCKIYPSVSTITYPTIIVTGYDRIYAGTIVRVRFADLKTLAAGFSDYCKLGVSYSYYNYGGAKGYIYEPVSFVVGPTSAPSAVKTITYTINEISSNYVGQLSDYTLSGSIANGFSPITTTDYFVVQFPKYSFEGRFNLNAQALCSLATNSFCNVFGLANQIYIQPASTVTAASFSFTIRKLLNAAYQLQYITQNITLFTLISNKVNALGYATFTKFTQASLNVSSIITSIDSIYGGDSGINYYFSFQLNSYLPETGKISIFFPSIYISLFTVNSKCYLRMDSQALAGTQAYCQIINTYQLVIVPNGVLFSTSQPYYVTVTNITNPNLDLSSYKFKIETYYFSDVYQAKVISRSYFDAPTFSLITVKKCQLQITASIYNQNLPSQYQINLICPATIKQSSELKLYLSWNPTQTNLTCQSDSNILYSTQCNIMSQFDQNVKKTYLSIYLRSIQAQKLISIVATVTNGNQGTYTIDSTINYNGFVYLTAKSNSYYVISTTSTSSGSITTDSTSTSNSLSVRTRNYPLNRYVSSIYTFALTNPKKVVSTLQIDVPSVITQSKSGITCGYLTWKDDDDYFNLMANINKNPLTCSMTGQKIVINDLSQVLTQLANSTNSNQFLYLIVSGIVNPATSVSLSNFTFTFINTTSSIAQAAGIFPLALSYTISDAPLNLQISNIALSDARYYISTLYTFTVTSVQSTNIVLVKNTLLGLMIHFPAEYSEIWGQITPPANVDLTISGTVYSATNITMIDRYLFARFTQNAFTSQLTFTSFTVAFNFRNPNKSIDCTVTPVFEFSLFDFKGNSVFAQTLSNNQICPSLRDRLFSVNVTGNTKISAGSSNAFIVSIQKPSLYLAVTPSCTSSAISFSPSVVTFKDFKSTQETFNISAAVGLSGYFNITFTKVEGSIKFYNDIQFITINVYIPIQSYSIKLTPFSAKSVGYPIRATFTLQVPSPTDFAITYKTTCNDSYAFIPADRISIPAQTTEVALYVQYKGSTVPEVCEITFAIYALTTNNFKLQTTTAYLSGKPSIDRSTNTPPLILELTTTAQNSTSVGQTIISKADQSSASSKKYYNAQTPTVYSLQLKSAGSNRAQLLATTSVEGIIYYAVLISGTPTSDITQSQIYNKNMSKAILYGSSSASLNVSGVNTISEFTITSLIAQTKYIVAAYVNSTVGNSPIIYTNISTSKASNGAAIKLGMNSTIDVDALLLALSNVWRIKIDRLAVITNQATQTSLQNSFTSQVMNSRAYVYEVVVAPDTEDDSKKPIDLLNDFVASTNDKYRLSTFIPQYFISYTSLTREIMPIKPQMRLNPMITQLSHNRIQLQVYTWQIANVSGIAVPLPASKPFSSQIANALDSNNNPIPTQHFSNVISIDTGVAVLTFTQLVENTNYAIYITASCVIPFKPALLLSDSEVASVQARTEVDLNLMKNQDQVVDVIKSTNPELAAQVEKHIKRMKNSESIQGVDKNKKRRE